MKPFCRDGPNRDGFWVDSVIQTPEYSVSTITSRPDHPPFLSSSSYSVPFTFSPNGLLTQEILTNTGTGLVKVGPKHIFPVDSGLGVLTLCRQPSLPRCPHRAGALGLSRGNYPSQRRSEGSKMASQRTNYTFSPKLFDSKDKSELPVVTPCKALLERHLPLLRCQMILL